MKQYFIVMIFVLFSSNVLADKLFIIGNKSSFNSIMTINEIKSIYLMQKKNMVDGRKIFPINLPADDSIRNVFSHAIFNKDAVSLADYWNRIAFRGIKPPLIQSSEKSVELFVSRVKGAIGYIMVVPKNNQVFILAHIDI